MSFGFTAKDLAARWGVSVPYARTKARALGIRRAVFGKVELPRLYRREDVEAAERTIPTLRKVALDSSGPSVLLARAIVEALGRRGVLFRRAATSLTVYARTAKRRRAVALTPERLLRWLRRQGVVFVRAGRPVRPHREKLRAILAALSWEWRLPRIPCGEAWEIAGESDRARRAFEWECQEAAS